ncbi:MAG: glycosyltransferase family 39 protein [Luteimonas sp.]
MRDEIKSRNAFLALWSGVLLLKAVLATHLPLFVDEAFYWQEGQHLAWAYSDLPGLTAWLTRIGTALGGNEHLALRAPFLIITAALPWIMFRITAREFDRAQAWQAASLTVLLPLAGTLGLLALPDAVMALATLVCIDAAARLLRGVTPGASAQLAVGLAIGALSHYRFIAVIAVGFVVLLWLPAGRRALRDPRTWIAIAFGAAAWTPLVAWNMDNADAGLRFQLIDRHPWAFHGDGIWFVLIQALLVTPLLFVAMAWSTRAAKTQNTPAARLFAGLGALIVLGFFALGFFADTERVSFHWPLPGYLALVPLLPAVLAHWPRVWRRATWALAALGLAGMFAYYAAVSIPDLRAQAAALKWYPSNFAGWNPLASTVRAMRETMPPDTRIVADDFKIGAELGFALGDSRIEVLDHDLNRRHGRAPQLRLWGLQSVGRAEWGDAPVLLVVGASDVQYRDLLRHYHALCERVGALPPPRVLNIDHGAQRFLLFALIGKNKSEACTTPAMAWFDTPVSGARVSGTFTVTGWAFKDGVGVSGVEVLLDGRVLKEADYGLPSPGTVAYWKISTDPSHPDVGFRARIDASGIAPGLHWLGLRLHGRDGSIETWSEQPLTIVGH